MISDEILAECAARAALAPTVHNTQPARWVRDDGVLSLFCDTDVGLAVGDPSGRDAALSCGAVLEGMVLALSAHGIGAKVDLTGRDTAPRQGLVAVAHLTLTNDGVEDVLHHRLEQRFTWRGAFDTAQVDLFGWTRADTRMVLDAPSRAWLAARNDKASHDIMQDRRFRAELLSWMRLSGRHPRAGLDGMDRAAMRMTGWEARFAPFVLGPFWRGLGLIGATKGVVAERDATLTAPVIALFMREKTENPVVSGQAYLRLCLEAASLGLAGWPMAALSDHPATNADIRARFGVPDDRRLVQVIRFGRPTDATPPRARRPLSEVLR